MAVRTKKGNRFGGSGSDDLVRRYLDEAGRHELLTAADEVALAQAIEAGHGAQERLDAETLDSDERRRLGEVVAVGADARRRFIQSNLRLVVSIAKRYQCPDLDLLDLVQEGNLGLMRAVDKFDWRKGFKFSTYATWWIRQAITRALADKGRTIRLPVHVVETRAALGRAAAELSRRHEREPSTEELAEATGIPIDKVREALEAVAASVSLSAPLDDDGDRDLDEVVADPEAASPFEAAAERLQRRDLAKVLSTLNERERSVLAMRFGLTGEEPRTLEDVGEAFHLTRERIRQIEAKALAKLRHPCSPAGARTLIAS
jgi:RNA polymerase sigma factor (sigma-70 family)